MEFYLNLNFYNIMNQIKENSRKTKTRLRQTRLRQTRLRLTRLRLTRQFKQIIKRVNKRIKTVCKTIFRSKSRKCMKGGWINTTNKPKE